MVDSIFLENVSAGCVFRGHWYKPYQRCTNSWCTSFSIYIKKKTSRSCQSKIPAQTARILRLTPDTDMVCSILIWWTSFYVFFSFSFGFSVVTYTIFLYTQFFFINIYTSFFIQNTWHNKSMHVIIIMTSYN